MSENNGSLTVKIDVKGIEEVARKLDLLPAFRDGVQAAGQYIKGLMQQYPPMTDSNAPGRTDAKGRPMSYYERGRGTWYPIARGGELYGYRLPQKTSKTLGRKWTIKAYNERLTCVIGNNTGYAQFVYDAALQARVHQRHGWQTTQQVADRESRKVAEIITDFMIAKLRETNPSITTLPDIT